ncbi:MAG: hypothetical protein JKX76_02150 [Colwellia sp.]|nr:hypothetical protein [Colwellia sp.]
MKKIILNTILISTELPYPKRFYQSKIMQSTLITLTNIFDENNKTVINLFIDLYNSQEENTGDKQITASPEFIQDFAESLVAGLKTPTKTALKRAAQPAKTKRQSKFKTVNGWVIYHVAKHSEAKTILESDGSEAVINAVCTRNSVVDQELVAKINGSTNKPQSYCAIVWNNMSDELQAPYIEEANTKTAANKAEYERALAAERLMSLANQSNMWLVPSKLNKPNDLKQKPP